MNNADQVKEVEKKIKATMKRLPSIVGNEVVLFSRMAFTKQGWLGDSFQPWPKRKSQSRWGKTPRNSGRAILVDTAKLRRGTRVISADWSLIAVGNSVPYARTHNEGVRVGVIQTVKAHRRKRSAGDIKGLRGKKIASGVSFVKAHQRKINQRIPQRKFLGNSPYLTRNIHRLIASQLNKAIS